MVRSNSHHSRKVHTPPSERFAARRRRLDLPPVPVVTVPTDRFVLPIEPIAGKAQARQRAVA